MSAFIYTVSTAPFAEFSSLSQVVRPPCCGLSAPTTNHRLEIDLVARSHTPLSPSFLSVRTFHPPSPFLHLFEIFGVEVRHLIFKLGLQDGMYLLYSFSKLIELFVRGRNVANLNLSTCEAFESPLVLLSDHRAISASIFGIDGSAVPPGKLASARWEEMMLRMG